MKTALTTIASAAASAAVSAAATATLWLAAPTLALAGEQQGVQCPAGATPHISNGNKKLQCTTLQVVERAAFCSPVVFHGNGDVTANTRIEQVTAGRDVCKVVGGTATAAPQFLPLPGDPPASEFTQITQSGADVFRATRTVFVYPVGGPIYNPLDDAAKGVSCPNGFDGDSRFDGRGIRCDKEVARKSADCDFPWSLLQDRSGNEDRCILANQTGGTKPPGITFIQMQVENALPQIGWFLIKETGADKWQKKEFAFPNSRG